MTPGMQDNLEQFIKDNKNEFDDLSPSDDVWRGVQQQLKPEKSSNSQLFIWKAAAMILFAFSLGLTLFVNRGMFQTSEQVVVQDEEFKNTENYYTSVINERQQLIIKVGQSFPDVEKDFELDWVALDQGYKSLKKEYEQNQNDEIKNALVQNLRARVNLLNRQIEVLEQIEKENISIIEI